MRSSEPSDAVKSHLGEVFAQVAKENPETVVVPGVENWITYAVLGTVGKNGSGITHTQTEGVWEMRDK